MRDTIELARMVGFQTGKRDYADGSSTYPFVTSVATGNFLVELKAFEALVRADERADCERVVGIALLGAEMNLAKRVLRAIRARGNT